MPLVEDKKTNAELTKQQAMYRKILAREFIREFTFLADVVAGRATEKGDFTDKLFDLAKSGLTGAICCAPVPCFVPQLVGSTITNVATKLSELGTDYLNDKRKESGSQWMANQNDMVDEQALQIVLERVALEAARRFEYIMAVKLSKDPLNGVIPFAKVGVERMLEYVARNNLPLTEENLLRGLIEGRSGAYVSGFVNNKIEGRDTASKSSLTIEGIYGRSAFRSQEAGEYYVLEEEEADAYWEAKHKQNDEKKKGLIGFIQHAKERLYTHPYSKLEKKGGPKYGYIEAPKETIQYFGFHKAALADWQKTVSAEHQPKTKTVGIAEVNGYLSDLKLGKATSFIEYVNSKFPGTVLVRCVADLTGFDLQNTDWTDCDMSGTNFSNAQLQGSKFVCAYLVGAVFAGADAKEADFSQAHMEYVYAEKAKFVSANFSHAHFEFANLKGADLSQIQQLGTSWGYGQAQAQVSGVKMEQAAPRRKHKSESSRGTEISKQREELDKLHKKFEEKSGTWDAKLTAQGNEIGEVLLELKREQQIRATFERYCEEEFLDLQRQITTLQIKDQAPALEALKAELDALKKAQDSLPSLLRHVDALMEKMNKGEAAAQKLKEALDEVKEDAREVAEEQAKQLAEQQKRFAELEGKLAGALEAVRHGEKPGVSFKYTTTSEDMNIANFIEGGVSLEHSSAKNINVINAPKEFKHYDGATQLMNAMKGLKSKPQVEETHSLSAMVSPKVLTFSPSASVSSIRSISSISMSVSPGVSAKAAFDPMQFDEDSSILIDDLREYGQSFQLKRDKNDTLWITLDADFISVEGGVSCIQQAEQLVKQHFGKFLSSTETESDGVVHALKLFPKTGQHAAKLEGQLKQTNLFAPSKSKNLLKQSIGGE